MDKVVSKLSMTRKNRANKRELYVRPEGEVDRFWFVLDVLQETDRSRSIICGGPVIIRFPDIFLDFPEEVWYNERDRLYDNYP